MELSLLRSLMNKDFYEDHRGARCPDRLFSKDARTIKHTIDKAMRKYNRDVTPDELYNTIRTTVVERISYHNICARHSKELLELLSNSRTRSLKRTKVGKDLDIL